MENTYKVAYISSNTNSFGLKQFIAVTKEGKTLKGCSNNINLPKKGDFINLNNNNFELIEFVDELAPDFVIEDVYGKC